MARRSDHNREELCELALDAAKMIVKTDGFRALTARNVADAIGYSPGTLYNLFDNLDGMIMHLNGRTLDTLYERLSSVRIHGIPEDDINGLLDGYLEFLEDHPNLWRTLFEYKLPEGVNIPDWYLRKVEMAMGLVEHALSPLFDEDDEDGAKQAARILWASLHGICSLSETGKLEVVTSQPVHDMAKGMVLHFITGLKQNLGKPNP